MSRRREVEGLPFGRWTVVTRVEGSQPPMVVAKCRCNNRQHIVRLASLVNGSSKSCGCLKNEHLSEKMGKLSRTHGMSRTRQYAAWVAATWDERPKFEDAMVALGPMPNNSTIQRIDSSKPFTLDNARWGKRHATQTDTRHHQAVVLEWNGERHSCAGWAKILGVTAACMKLRVKNGFTGERLFAPKQPRAYVGTSLMVSRTSGIREG